MGMGYFACVADVVEHEDLEGLCPETFAAFRAALLESEEIGKNVRVAASTDDYLKEEMRRIAHEYTMLDAERDMPTAIREAYEALQTDFNRNTGLHIDLVYHDLDDGSMYDEVSGPFWNVKGVYQPTPEGQKALESGLVTTRNYVSFG